MHEITLLQGIIPGGVSFRSGGLIFWLEALFFIPPDNRLYPYRCYSR